MADRATPPDVSAGAPSGKPAQSLSATTVEQIERLLGGRTRGIRLNRELAVLFRERSWRQTAKIIRAWMTCVIVLDFLTLGLNAFLLPAHTAASMLAPASILPPAALVTAIVFRKPQAFWLQGCVLLTSMFLILLSVALVGVSTGGEFYERHLTVRLRMI